MKAGGVAKIKGRAVVWWIASTLSGIETGTATVRSMIYTRTEAK